MLRAQGVVEQQYKGAPKRVMVVLEDRAGGRKHITRITAMEAFAIDPDELAALLQRRFQSSASVARLPGKTEAGKEIALQGNVLGEVPAFLMQEYGINSSFIDCKSRSKTG